MDDAAQVLCDVIATSWRLCYFVIVGCFLIKCYCVFFLFCFLRAGGAQIEENEKEFLTTNLHYQLVGG